MEKPSAAVIIPTYNEADNITAIVNDLLEVFHGSGIEGWIVVVDDGSPDGTGRIVGEIAAGNPMVMLLERGRKMGIGSAYIDGFRYVLSKMDVRAAVTMDADGSHPPQMVPHLIKEEYYLSSAC
jgi:dolichol-phosphate mannosyltransferase